jgi:hypothetical protein
MLPPWGGVVPGDRTHNCAMDDISGWSTVESCFAINCLGINRSQTDPRPAGSNPEQATPAGGSSSDLQRSWDSLGSEGLPGEGCHTLRRIAAKIIESRPRPGGAPSRRAVRGRRVRSPDGACRSLSEPPGPASSPREGQAFAPAGGPPCGGPTRSKPAPPRPRGRGAVAASPSEGDPRGREAKRG